VTLNWVPRLSCHPLCDMYFMLVYTTPVRRFHFSCATCYRRRLHYHRRGWQGLKRYSHFEVVADSVYADGSPLPADYRVYWLVIRKDGIISHPVRRAICKALMKFADALRHRGKEGPRRIKKDVTIADCLNFAGTILPKEFSAYFIFMPTDELPTRTYRNMLRKTFLTVAEFIAQI